MSLSASDIGLAMRADIRRKAALKAWRTRRRLAKISPKMAAVLRFLTQSPGYRICLHYTGRICYFVTLRARNVDGSEYSLPYDKPRRVTLTTFMALKLRRAITPAGQFTSGSSTSWDRNGKPIRVECFDLDYRISEHGHKLLAANLAR
jgi:hypothetical protein